MCFYLQQSYPIAKVQKRFKAIVVEPKLFVQDENINGFAHPNVPIILDQSPEIITTSFTWGLLPSRATSLDFRKNTLNARIETIHEKPSFKSVTANRCLIIASAFYEWHWNDEKGKSKQKFQINTTEELFAVAGLYSKWVNPETGEQLGTFTMVTTAANKTMEYIHNHKKRMPVILKKEDESHWLNPQSAVEDFAFPYEVGLVAFEVP
jgi:putative SOS response-associated peptidase YedK